MLDSRVRTLGVQGIFMQSNLAWKCSYFIDLPVEALHKTVLDIKRHMPCMAYTRIPNKPHSGQLPSSDKLSIIDMAFYSLNLPYFLPKCGCPCLDRICPFLFNL